MVNRSERTVATQVLRFRPLVHAHQIFVNSKYEETRMFMHVMSTEVKQTLKNGSHIHTCSWTTTWKRLLKSLLSLLKSNKSAHLDIELMISDFIHAIDERSPRA
jgi:hypothetical protein